MRVLGIEAQDIRFITLGLKTDEGIIEEVKKETEPDAHMRAIHTFLLEHDLSPSDLDAVFVVTGPGSFTASRVSTTIANAISFTQRIPILSAENPDRRPLRSFLEALTLPAFGASPQFAAPTYDQPPRITKPNKSQS